MTTTKKRVQRVKMRAVQPLFTADLTLIAEGEIFVFEGDELPAKHIAMRVDSDMPLGVLPEPPRDPTKKEPPPPWTTTGFVEEQNREMGRRDDVDDLLD